MVRDFFWLAAAARIKGKTQALDVNPAIDVLDFSYLSAKWTKEIWWWGVEEFPVDYLSIYLSICKFQYCDKLRTVVPLFVFFWGFPIVKWLLLLLVTLLWLEFQFLRCYRATTPTLGCFDSFFPVPRIQYRASRLSLNLESSLLPFSCLNPVHCDAKSCALLAKQWEKIWTK